MNWNKTTIKHGRHNGNKNNKVIWMHMTSFYTFKMVNDYIWNLFDKGMGHF